MSTVGELCSQLRLNIAFCAVFLVGAASVAPANAESEPTGEPSAQYASLPAATAPDTTEREQPATIKVQSHTDTLMGGTRIVLRPGTPVACLPTALRDAVADLSSKFGPISVESTRRTTSRNQHAGGARHSLHLFCRAVDFRVHARARGVMAYLRSRPEIGGLKIYRNGIIHIDNGSRRSW